MSKKKSHQNRSVLPEYQMLPTGIWHMLTAVLLMVICLSLAVFLTSSLLSSWLNEHSLVYFELGSIVILMLILATATFLVTRGRSVFHGFLIWFNRACLTTLLVGTLLAFLAGTYGVGLTGLVGITMASLAHQLYGSSKYRQGVEHYRKIWSYHRSVGSQK
ncbi:hypothetical protein SAMN04488051_103484 [Alkalimonas amylolytica]|uniref:Uncharacterized protein n=1 Tax=Alkalimonas amylolytica TaxID=152573 RepID=A0A1H4BRG2_ALKAM|nr:hypothetical protein SAMN04488051_103484 [Alkalimonas amylolytica]